MKKRDWIKIISLLLLVVIVDQYTKLWAQSKPETFYGPLHIVLVHNHGAMLGLFSDLTAFLRIVMLSTSGFFVLSLYFFLQYIIPIPILNLRYGLSLLVGGIIGNVLDRVFYGYVIDFVSIDAFNWHSPVWNIADMIQWIGYILISYCVIKHGHLFWPDQNARNRFWVNQSFQIKFTSMFIAVGLLLTMISFVFSYTYLKLSLTELVGFNNSMADKYTTAFVFSFCILIGIFSMTLFVVGRKVSHHIAGPVYAFERYLADLLDEKYENKPMYALKLRAGDDFRHLEKSAEALKIKIEMIQQKHKLNLAPTETES
jgi:signal peptidase II